MSDNRPMKRYLLRTRTFGEFWHWEIIDFPQIQTDDDAEDLEKLAKGLVFSVAELSYDPVGEEE